MKKIIMLILMGVLFITVSCDKEETNSSNSKDVVLNMNKLAADSVLLIGSQNNPFNDEGMAYFRALELLYDTIENGYLSSQEEKELYIENNFIDSLSLSVTDIEMFRVFFLDVEFNYENILTFENQVLQMDVPSNNVLLALSYLKYSYAYADMCEPGGGSSYTQYSYCLDNCIKRKLQEIEDSNWIDQAAFVYSCPFSFGLIVASCTWECS